MAFTTEVPEESGPNFGVLAYLDDVLALAHFYPMVAVYDDEGWNSEPPAEGGDVTYSDTSFYLARITAPSDVVVVAGGVEIGREEAGDSQALTFAAGPMRDFYLAASDRLTAVSDVVGQTNIHSYAPPELAEGAEAALQNASNALQVFSDRFGPYPFTELDIVSTSTLALGIEYPGIIAITLREYDLAGNISPGLPNSVLMESTVAHEVAHQWFYSLVGNDQLDEPWLDEALAQYATLLYYRDTYGENGAQGFYASLEGRWARVEEAEIPIGLPVGAYEDAEYGAIVYGRGPIFVDTLAQTMGQETFDAFLRDYAVTYRWDIARTEAMKQVAEEHCACDLTPLFAEWVYAE
jgi:aminopeptidase N